MNEFDQYYRAMMAQFNAEDEEEPCLSTIRRDALRNKVKVPYGGTYKQGKNGRGIGIPRGSTSKEDRVGQLHVLKPGQKLVIGKDGKGQVTCQNKMPQKEETKKPMKKLSDLA